MFFLACFPDHVADLGVADHVCHLLLLIEVRSWRGRCPTGELVLLLRALALVEWSLKLVLVRPVLEVHIHLNLAFFFERLESMLVADLSVVEVIFLLIEDVS